MDLGKENTGLIPCFLVFSSLVACSSPPAVADPAQTTPTASAAPPPSTQPTPPAPPSSVSSTAIALEIPPATPEPLAVSKVTATRILFAAGVPTGTCQDTNDKMAIRCLIEKRYESDASAKSLATSLFDDSGHVAGVEHEYMMDGGFRGTIHIVPEWPFGKYEKHLKWVTASASDFNIFFDKLVAKSEKPVRYRHRGIAFKFLRSVNRATPSAYASDWSIGYNVSGSLHASVDAVRETLFHEIFHLNDSDHAIESMNWSAKTLGAIHETILSKCSTRIACLTPYAPMTTMVRGGTYYAFQPNNGQSVHEYGAELATRYYREHRAIIRGEKLKSRPFKCGPKENAEAWKLIVDEFFGGIDWVPAC